MKKTGQSQQFSPPAYLAGTISLKSMGITFLAILLFFVAIFTGVKRLNHSSKENPEPGLGKSSYKVEQLSFLLERENRKIETPDDFPKDFPVVDSDGVFEAYARDQKTGDITVKLNSKKSVKENFSYYTEYGKNNDWKIDEAKESEDVNPAKILLRKDKMIITIVLSEKENGSEVVISSTSLSDEIISEGMDIKNLNLSQ